MRHHLTGGCKNEKIPEIIVTCRIPSKYQSWHEWWIFILPLPFLSYSLIFCVLAVQRSSNQSRLVSSRSGWLYTVLMCTVRCVWTLTRRCTPSHLTESDETCYTLPKQQLSTRTEYIKKYDNKNLTFYLKASLIVPFSSSFAPFLKISQKVLKILTSLIGLNSLRPKAKPKQTERPTPHHTD